jgi:DNA-binding NtrC family response regulator
MQEQDGTASTLASVDQGRSLRLPALQVTAKLPDGRKITAPLGLHPCLVGTSPDCDLALPDSHVSRRHCELQLTERGIVLRDLASKNGTFVRDVAVMEARLLPGVPIQLGDTELVIEPIGEAAILPLSTGESFGHAIGRSLAMRALFSKLERAAPTDETVLLLGESGTGKEVLAQEIHAHSPRKDKPFVVIDCGAIAPDLVESELFGHEKGAFTGANAPRTGLLAQAEGGTLFIDELGELPLDLQPKLLRAIEKRQIRRLGSEQVVSFDARIVAATHRNLRAKIQDGSFRADLYFRLSVVEVHVPALRERKDDIPLFVERFLKERTPPRSLADLPAGALPLLEAYDWPGNVRELRNTVARLLLFPEMMAEIFGASAAPAPGAAAAPTQAEDPAQARLNKLLELSLPEAREAVLEELERAYVTAKLAQHNGVIAHAAEAMGVTRQLLHRLLARYGLSAR